jgi:hypothetical protein
MVGEYDIQWIYEVLYSAIYKWEILHSWDLSVWSLRLYGAMYCYVASLVFAEAIGNTLVP